jgi:hypothetical protein
MKEKPRIQFLWLLLVISISFFILIVSASSVSGSQFVIYSVHTANNDHSAEVTNDNYIVFSEAGQKSWSEKIDCQIGSIAISPDGEYVAAGCDRGVIYLYSTQWSAQLLWKRTFGDVSIKSISFQENSNFIDATNVLNQAFLITRSGNLVNRPTPSPVSSVTTATISSISTTASADFLPLKINFPFIDGEANYLWIVLVLCFIVVLVIYITQVKQGARSFGKIKDLLNLKNLTIFSFILIFIGIGFSFTHVVDFSKTFILLGIIGFIFSYYLYAVFSWGADNKITAILMIAIPLIVYFVSTNKIPGSMNIILYCLIIFVIYGAISAILLFISDKLKWGIDQYILKIKSKSHRFFLPNISYIFLGIGLISLLAISAGNTALLSENVNSALQSTTNYASNSQNAQPTPAPTPAPYNIEYATVQTSQTKSINIPIPIASKNYETGLTSKIFAYVLRGKSATINVILYSGVYDEISSKERPAACIRYNYDTSPCTNEEIRQYYLKYLDDPDQKKYLDSLVKSIESASSVKDDQARIAISLVQQIPYDYNKFSRLSSSTSASIEKTRYPYEVLYDGKGVCSEKSVLLAYLLRGLGYGVVLFEFPSENHMAVGIKSSAPYDFKNSGYAFVETAEPTIPTDDQEMYVGVGKLTTTPTIFAVSDGISFNSIVEEYKDAKTFNQIQLLSKSSGGIIEQNYYYAWLSLVQKYGLKIGNY